MKVFPLYPTSSTPTSSTYSSSSPSLSNTHFVQGPLHPIPTLSNSQFVHTIVPPCPLPLRSIPFHPYSLRPFKLRPIASSFIPTSSNNSNFIHHLSIYYKVAVRCLFLNHRFEFISFSFFFLSFFLSFFLN